MLVFFLSNEWQEIELLKIIWGLFILGFFYLILKVVIIYLFDKMDASYAKHLNSTMCASIYAFDSGLNSYLGSTETVDFPEIDEPIWILGQKYSSLHQLRELRDDYRTKIWMTYRKNFVPIGGNGPSSDQGWGCMLRCGQMVLAQAFVMNTLGRDWRWMGCKKFAQEDKKREELRDADNLNCNNEAAFDNSFDEINHDEELKKLACEKEEHEQYLKILKQFQDKKKCPYSIHQIASMGATEAKPVGTWMGPNMIAQTLKKLSAFDHSNNYNIFVAMDNAVVIEEIKEICKQNEDENNWKPLLLFIPLRLGLTEINSIYFKSLKTTFMMKQSLGIIGGRPNHALYFVGFCHDELIYLDPHTNQNAVDLDEGSLDNDFFIDDISYHCKHANRMDISQLDPSISLCFFFKTEAEFNLWCSGVRKFLIYDEKQPLFELSDCRPNHWVCSEALENQDYNDYDLGVNSNSNDKTETDDDEDFELLG